MVQEGSKTGSGSQGSDRESQETIILGPGAQLLPLCTGTIARVRNEEVRRAGIEKELASRADQRVLRWFGHVERMDEYRMARRVLMAEVSGGRVRTDRG